MADKLRTQQELERLQIKHIGTGHTDYPGWEWKTNIYRDTYSNLVGHPAQMAYMALALNEPASKIHPKLVWKMLQPAGPPPPERTDDEEDVILVNGHTYRS